MLPSKYVCVSNTLMICETKSNTTNKMYLIERTDFLLYNISLGIYAQATWIYVRQVIETIVFL